MSLRDAIAEALHDHGPLREDDGQETADWRDCGRAEVHEAVADKIASLPAVTALLAVVDDVRNSGHYDTCDSELTDAPCSCPRGKVDRLDELEQT